MTAHHASIVQEGLALIGLGLFAVGLWQVYPPACFISVGVIFAAPFLCSLRGAK